MNTQDEINRLAEDDRVAWRVSIDDITCITFAKTAKAARCNAVLAAREAGFFMSGTWPTAHTSHVHEFDTHYLREQSVRDRRPRQTWSELYVRYGR